MLDLLFYMILGHYCGDFAFQTDRMAQGKQNSLAALSVHVIIYTLTLALFIALGMFLNGNESFFTVTTAMVIILIFLMHWVQDRIKARWFNGSKQAYYLDQAIHIAVLFAARLFVFNG